jgi:hypothetical protein
MKKGVPHIQTTFFFNLTTDHPASLLADVYTDKRGMQDFHDPLN